VLWKGGREPDARACLAAAQAFRAGPAPENPIARALLEAVLAPVIAGLEEQKPPEAEPSLLVKP
jgi:hypothetical protein